MAEQDKPAISARPTQVRTSTLVMLTWGLLLRQSLSPSLLLKLTKNLVFLSSRSRKKASRKKSCNTLLGQLDPADLYLRTSSSASYSLPPWSSVSSSSSSSSSKPRMYVSSPFRYSAHVLSQYRSRQYSYLLCYGLQQPVYHTSITKQICSGGDASALSSWGQRFDSILTNVFEVFSFCAGERRCNAFN